MTTDAAAAAGAPPPPPPSQSEWWVLSVTTGPGPGKFMVIQGTAAAVHAKYDGAVSGPYPNQAAAQAAANTPGGGFPGANIPGEIHVSNPLAFLGWLQDIGHWVGVAVAAITDRYMWISLGWLFLGFILLVAGVLSWIIKYTDVKGVAELGAVLA